MRIDDPVYGPRTVDEPVLKDLVDSDPVQRLRKIQQAGPQRYFMDKTEVTRFEHSVGVMLLLREHGAAVAEQIAGLLHDVPHTAFSHVVDFVYGNEDHEFHERFMEDVVMDSDIPDILDRHGFDVSHILDEDNFPLLERDLPDLCADRIDYFLRDVNRCAGEPVSRFREALDVRDGRFVLTDRDIAREYALTYIEADERFWANPKEMAIFHLFARAIRRALDIGVLSQDDLFRTDAEVMEMLRDADDPEIAAVLERLDGIVIALDPDDPDFTVTTKVRYVDPHVVDGGELVRVSDYADEVRARIAEHRETVESGYPVRVVS